MKTNKLLKLTSAIALAACFSVPAQAGFITGTIDFGGFVTPRDATNTITSLDLATKLDFGALSVTFGGTGDYASVIPLTSVAYNDVTFSPFSGPLTPLWSFISGVKTYAFNLDTVTILTQTAHNLNLGGTGVLKLTGFNDTPGKWNMSLDNADGNIKTKVSFATSNSTVPEPMTLGLLGIGVSMLTARRKLLTVKA